MIFSSCYRHNVVNAKDCWLLKNEEVKAFVAINFGKCIESTRETWHSKLDKEKDLRKIAEPSYSF